jgi:hypothetical protein
MREYDRLDFVSHALWAIAWAFAVAYLLMLVTPE